ncbi:hypothetical protein PR003_g17813 [Phytophthora rubi]|uniref:Integrase catalytic domain-containing protein n=1 Tax=Phytophthora rubi TaxID=129364 RepID=A0A6A4EAX9_9STRA|nr:hypothetical protein PR003_g17813 [Phytophthora rubi]
MDFVTHMPKSARGNTFLLLFQDIFSGYVMCKPMNSTTAQDVAEAYEERVFRSFGASSLIRHDQDPRFMSEVFTRFRELLGSRQRATLAYRPQATGQQERFVQTVIRSVRAYIAEADQSDWDDHAERLMFALNTSFDATRLETPFYLVHGWDAQGTVSAMLGPRPSSVQEKTAYEWRRKFQRDHSYALASGAWIDSERVVDGMTVAGWYQHVADVRREVSDVFVARRTMGPPHTCRFRGIQAGKLL